MYLRRLVLVFLFEDVAFLLREVSETHLVLDARVKKIESYGHIIGITCLPLIL